MRFCYIPNTTVSTNNIDDDYFETVNVAEQWFKDIINVTVETGKRERDREERDHRNKRQRFGIQQF